MAIARRHGEDAGAFRLAISARDYDSRLLGIGVID
jgi:hypothetical protein